MPKHPKTTYERLSDLSDELYDIVNELEEKTKAGPMYFARRDRVVNVERLDTSVEPPVAECHVWELNTHPFDVVEHGERIVMSELTTELDYRRITGEQYENVVRSMAFEHQAVRRTRDEARDQEIKSTANIEMTLREVRGDD